MNKEYEEGELIEMLCGEEEYRGDKKEEESFEDIDITLCEDFDKDTYILNGDSDDEE